MRSAWWSSWTKHFDAWLNAPASESMEFMRQFPAEHLVGIPVASGKALQQSELMG